ncbi:MAG: CPBP family glutamic-type intramembrane protease, partial [Limisphaerales bacterium]
MIRYFHASRFRFHVLTYLMLSEKPWRGDAVIQFCAAQFTCLCLGVVAAGLLHKFGISGFKQPDDFGNILLGTLSFQGVTWILISIFLRQHHVGWRETFGFRGPRLKFALFLAVIVLAVILPVAVLLQRVSVEVLEKIGWPVESQAAVLMLAAAKTWWMRIYFGVFAIVIAPVAEEFIFRGMLFPFIKRLGFPKLAWFGVSFLFAAIHFD